MTISPRRFPLVILLGAAILLLTALLSLALGAVSLNPGQVAVVVGRRILSLIQPSVELVPRPDLQRVEAIVLYIRLPRTAAAILAGYALALSGAAVQGLFRNPMASPDVLGISAGSSFGAVLAIATGLHLLHPLIMPAAAFAGATSAAFFVYIIGSRRGSSRMLLVILAGLAVSSLLNGMVSATLLFAEKYELNQFLFWTMGGLESVLPEHLLWPAPLIAVFSILIFFLAQPLNLLSLGDEQAHSLGIPVERVKLLVLLSSSLMTALAIAVAGPIGFVGLMVPHLMRILTGANHRYLLPLSALGGAVFLLLSDIIGRSIIPPYEIKTGIVTSLIGGPYFIFLIIRYQRKGRVI
jgi:iron complex transport system permease protein